MLEEIAKQYHEIIKHKVRQMNFSSALASIEKLLKNFPNDKQGHYYKGVCSFAMNDYSESIKQYMIAINLDQGYAKAYFNLGASLYEMNKIDLALINIAKALIIFDKKKLLDEKKRCINALKIIEQERKI